MTRLNNSKHKKVKVIRHKWVGSCDDRGRGCWNTICGSNWGQSKNSRVVYTWRYVNCKKCLKLKGSGRDFLKLPEERYD